MTISLYSVIMGLFSASIVFVVAALLSAMGRRIRWQAIVLIVSLGNVRLLLPVEFGIAKIIQCRRIYPAISRLLGTELWPGSSLMNVLTVIWIIGIIGQLLFFMRIFLCGKRRMRTGRLLTEEERAYGICEKVSRELNCPMTPQVYVIKGIPSPASVGMRSPVFLFPEDMLDFSDRELESVFRHETYHFLRNDMGKYLAMILLTCVFWWNPVVHILRKLLENKQEMECDACVCENMTERERLDYLDCILKVVKMHPPKHCIVGPGYARGGNNCCLERRFREVLSPGKVQTVGQSMMLSFAAILFFLSTYLFILQPA